MIMDLKIKANKKSDEEIIEIFSIGDEEGNKLVDVELDLTPSKVAKAQLFAMKNKKTNFEKSPEQIIEFLSLIIRNYDDVLSILMSQVDQEDFEKVFEAIMGKYQNLTEERS